MNGKLKPDVKAKWLEALRSGQYQQGRFYLHRELDEGRDQFCCLGVLCDIAAKEGVTRITGHSVHDSNVVTYDKKTGLPPSAVVHWAYGEGSSLLNGEWTVRVGDEYRELNLLNDVERLDFPTIADIIDQYL